MCDGFLGPILLGLRAAFGTLTTPSSLKHFLLIVSKSPALLGFLSRQRHSKLFPSHLIGLFSSPWLRVASWPLVLSVFDDFISSQALSNIYMPLTFRFISPVWPFLNSRFVYPTASVTSPLGCVIEILNKQVQICTPNLFPTSNPKIAPPAFCSSQFTVMPSFQWSRPTSLESFLIPLFFLTSYPALQEIMFTPLSNISCL